MVSANDKARIVKAVMNYMDMVSKSVNPRGNKKIANSPQLRSFLTRLSENASSKMVNVLRSVLEKCEKNLLVWKEIKAAKKRAAPQSHGERNAKRQKRSRGETCSANAQTVQQDHSEHDETGLAKDGIPSCQESAHCSETAPEPTEYEIEIGLGNGSPFVKDFVETSLLALEYSTRPSSNPRDEVANILKIVRHLDFFQNRHELYNHLQSREKTTNDRLQARTNWNISEPGEIIDALENVKRSSLDNKIHRAYGQTMLVMAVENKLTKKNESSSIGSPSDHKAILEEAARERSGPVTKEELDQLIASYLYEYAAGIRWRKVMDWFGGSGIVFIFVIGGTNAPFWISL